MFKAIENRLSKPTEAAPLAVFRILFGLVMLVSLIRFSAYGWIEKLYIQPQMHFTYYGFHWVKPLGNYSYLLFVVCMASTVFVMLGYKYRWASIIFFLSFTYIELIDKTTYLNHYYFISLLSFLLIFLPANAYYSLDAKKDENVRFQYIPQWNIWAIMLLLGIVYFCSGLAKINSEWMLKAMPLKIWLPSKYNFPLLGDLFQKEWVAYAFSWSGMVYDLSIVFFLLWRNTRTLAFIVVVFFHLLTSALFPIGMFPYIMILSTLIFFDSTFHHKLLSRLSYLFRINKSLFDNGALKHRKKNFLRQVKGFMLISFFAINILFPFRYLLYPGELFWTEEGYRFSWRVMLMEKTGYAQFKVLDKDSGKQFYINNTDYLTAFQEKQMSTQPDFMLQYARYLYGELSSQGQSNLAIYVDSYVALNGGGSKVYINPELDLLTVEDSFEHKNWINNFED